MFAGRKSLAKLDAVLATCVALVLAYAGLSKLADPDAFALAVGNYHLLPRFALTPMGYLLPPLEVVAALSLVYPPTRSAGWLIATGLFALFALAVGSALQRGLDLSCGCFGQAMSVSWLHLLANAVLVALCVWRARDSRGGGQPLVGPGLHPAGENLDPSNSPIS